MSLVGSERVEVYWGSGVLLYRRGQGPGQALSLPPGEPPAQVLQRLADALQLRPRRRWAWPPRVHWTLGAAHCPAVGFALPAGVRHWREVHSLVLAAAQQRYPGSQWVCAFDAGAPGLGAVLGADLHHALLQWSAGNGLRVASLRPLWALALGARPVRKAGVHALWVGEPGALTCVGQGAARAWVADSFLGPAQEDAARALARRWCLAQGIEQTAALHYQFSTQLVAQVAPPALAHWRGHWSQP